MNNIPIYYDYKNVFNSYCTPSEVHVRDNALQRFFCKQLLQKAISVFKWKLPSTWAKDYFLYTLYCNGFVAVADLGKFGVLPQHCGLKGYDIMYRPTNAVITNPLLKDTLEPRINEECVVFKLRPDYTSIMDIVNFYADKMAITCESIDINTLNSKLAVVFEVSNKAEAESMKKIYDEISEGKPAVFFDKHLTEGGSGWNVFVNNLKSNYIGAELLEVLNKYIDMFLTDIGLNNTNSGKRERMIVDEVNANNEEVKSMSDLWIEQLQEDVERCRTIFGFTEDELSVDWRFKTLESGVVDNGESVNIGTV